MWRRWWDNVGCEDVGMSVCVPLSCDSVCVCVCVVFVGLALTKANDIVVFIDSL
jgi:hypothetical protein